MKAEIGGLFSMDDKISFLSALGVTAVQPGIIIF